MRKKTKRPDKEICQRAHFKKRLFQRFGIVVNKESYRTIVDGIVTGSPFEMKVGEQLMRFIASYRGRQSHRVSIFHLWNVETDMRIPVAFDKQRQELVTAHEGIKAHDEDPH